MVIVVSVDILDIKQPLATIKMMFEQTLPSVPLFNSTAEIPSVPTHIVPNMTTYPTPPSSSGDSPQPIYFVASPNSNSFSVASPDMNQHYIQAQILPQDTNIMNVNNIKLDKAPFLRFIEQPTNKFRFRYKSEMAGTHGSLCGMTSDKSRKQTYPTVELMKCSEKSVIRCSIYQYNIEEDFKPHPHRLIMKRGREEFDDPHDIQVGPEEGFVATFHSMGIIHTARKNIVGELVRKKSLLKKEFNARMEGHIRELSHKELVEIKVLAEQESKSINLNIVCLRFDAFIVKNGIRSPICEPIFTHGINNLKCALTGDLKIVRMDRCTSPAKGGKEVFLLVERVTKKNIKIRFFELDDDEQEVWEGYGKFTELDVHHQYAIVFKTPAYDRVPNISSPVRVFMELVRPSDNARSEWKEFRYVPNNEFKPGAKRPRSSLYSSSNYSYNSGSLGSGEIPATINNLDMSYMNPMYSTPTLDSWNNKVPLTDEQMTVAVNDMDSDEFRILFDLYENEIPQDITSNTKDSPMEICSQLNEVHIGGYNNYPGRIHRALLPRGLQRQPVVPSTIIKMEVSEEDLAFAERTYSELKSFIKSKDAHKRAPQMLQHYLGEINKTNALHVFIGLNRKEEVTFLLKMIVLSKQYSLTNVANIDSLTPLHIAVMCRNEEFMAYLLQCEADPCCAARSGKTALHIAVESASGPKILEILLSTKHTTKLIDLENYNGETALYVAIERRNMTAVKILCKNGANINKKHQKNGFTPLRTAVENQNADAVKYLLEHPNLDLKLQNDFKDVTPFQAANIKQSSQDIMDLINQYMADKGIAIELKKEIEEDDEDSDEEMEEEIEIKPEIILPTEDPEALFNGVKELTQKCLDEVAAILDESGKYHHLAELLDLSHLLHTGIISNEQSVSKNLLLYAIEKDNVNILDIRNFLENLDEFRAVGVLDQMARELKSPKT